MMQIIQNITVEVAKPNFFQAIVAKQYDNNSRFLKVTLVHNGNKVEVATTSTVTINAKRNDGNSNSFLGVVNDDSTVTVPINFWMLELKGTLVCDVSVMGADESKLTTTTFVIEVEEAACTNGDISTEIITSIVTVVPPEKGGTGAETLKDARYAMNFLGANPVASDTPAAWVGVGTGYAYISSSETPCFIHNYVCDNTVYQIRYSLSPTGTIYHRGGSTDGWYGDWQFANKYPTLTDAQKQQMQDLIRQYSSMRQALFYYTGAVRRESYVTPACITNTGYSTEIQLGCVYKFQDDKLDAKVYTNNGVAVPDKTDRYYYKYMLNCGLYCQMLWMGRPISDFITEGEGVSLTGADNKDLLYYVNNKLIAPQHHALNTPPANISKNINSVFKIGNVPWGYYFDFELSKRMYKATNSDNSYYRYNSFFKYKNEPTVLEITEPTDERYTITNRYGKITAHPLTNQVIVDRRVALKINQPLDAGTAIVIGTISNYKPDHTTALAVYHPDKIFTGVIATSGEISVKCAEALSTGTCYVSVNASYSSPTTVESEGTSTPLGFDGAANMAEELYVMGCEVPYSEIDIGDLVFFRNADISDDFRNTSTSDDDDAMSNRLFRHISHVGIVFDFDSKGYPIISDCTDAYSYPIVIGRTSLESSDTFSKVKASYERNNVVMVARHPAAFGLGGNVPTEFEPYRGTLVSNS